MTIINRDVPSTKTNTPNLSLSNGYVGFRLQVAETFKVLGVPEFALSPEVFTIEDTVTNENDEVLRVEVTVIGIPTRDKDIRSLMINKAEKYLTAGVNHYIKSLGDTLGDNKFTVKCKIRFDSPTDVVAAIKKLQADNLALAEALLNPVVEKEISTVNEEVESDNIETTDTDPVIDEIAQEMAKIEVLSGIPLLYSNIGVEADLIDNEYTNFLAMTDLPDNDDAKAYMGFIADHFMNSDLALQRLIQDVPMIDLFISFDVFNPEDFTTTEDVINGYSTYCDHVKDNFQSASIAA